MSVLLTSWIDFRRWDIASLAAQWRQARPFGHVILDQVLSPEALAAVNLAVMREPHHLEVGEITEVWVSSQPMADPTLRHFTAALGGEAGQRAVQEITGREIGRLELRSHLYLPGHYLLPHVDDPYDAGRLVVVVYYSMPFGPCQGGELELFGTRLEARRIIEAAPALAIAPRVNRMVLFEVSDGALHRVREVTGGVRVALSGWFYQ